MLKHFLSKIFSRKVLFFLILFAITLGFFAYIQWSETFPDPDSFYHAKMAVIIKEGGVIKDFKWLPYTTLSENYTDHHFLYHLLLVPFVVIFPPLMGLKLATILLSSLAVVAVYWFLRQLGVQFAWWFGLLLLAINPFVFRLNLAKATAVSLIILLLCLYCLLSRKYWWLVFLSFIYVWSYGGWPLLLFFTINYILIETVVETISEVVNNRSERLLLNDSSVESIKRSLLYQIINQWSLAAADFLLLGMKKLISRKNLILFGAVVLGLGLGIVLSPYFPSNLYFYWQQIVEIGIINQQKTIGVGGEWYPYQLTSLVPNTALVFILTIISLILFFVNLPKNRAREYFFLSLFLFFFLITLKSRRYVEYFVPFALIFDAWTINAFLAGKIKKADFGNLYQRVFREKDLFYLIIIGYFVLTLPYIIINDAISNKTSYDGGFKYDTWQASSEWLVKNSAPNAIIFHSDWDEFPILFYHDSRNRYIAGLDPTFLYKHDEKRYWDWCNITIGNTTKNLHEIIREEFGADYVFVTNDHTDMIANLENNQGFSLRYKDEEARIYQVD